MTHVVRRNGFWDSAWDDYVGGWVESASVDSWVGTWEGWEDDTPLSSLRYRFGLDEYSVPE
jgi:hypothetical protein